MADEWSMTFTENDDEYQAVLAAGPYDERRTVGRQALARGLGELRPGATSLLPPMVRWVSATGRYLIIERPPALRTVAFCPRVKYNVTPETTRRYTIPVPWTIYAVGVGPNFTPTSIHVFATRGPLRSLDDPISLLPLPNLSTDGRFCLPGVDPVRRDLTGTLMAAVEVVWSSGFNLDMWDAVRMCKSHGRPYAIFARKPPPRSAAGVFRHWSRLSLAEALSIPDWLTVTRLPTVRDLTQMLGFYEQGNVSPTHLYNLMRKTVSRAAAEGTGADVRRAV